MPDYVYFEKISEFFNLVLNFNIKFYSVSSEKAQKLGILNIFITNFAIKYTSHTHSIKLNKFIAVLITSVLS